MISILVTAAGSELAFSIIKALQVTRERHALTLIGCDIYPDVVGAHWCDFFAQVPPAREEDSYIDALTALIQKHQITVLIPTIDFETSVLARYKKHFLDTCGCHVLVNEPFELERYNDKWLAYQWFLEHGIASPRTFLADSIADLERQIRNEDFPFILKPRAGGGSRETFRVDTFDALRKYLPIVPRAILQTFVGSADEEYTAGTYKDRRGGVRVIVLKRTLKFGMTNTAETVENDALSAFCRDAIEKTALQGSNNIQFRMGDDGPQIFEINPRFSGTVGIRAHFGFNDVEMAICEALDLPFPEPRITQGKVLRYMHELYVSRG